GRLKRDLGLRVQGVLRAFERARRTRLEALQLLVGRLVQVGLQDRELVGLGLVVPGVGAGVTGAGQGAVSAVDRAAQRGAGRVPERLQLLAFGHGERQGAALVAGLHAREHHLGVAERPAALVGQRPGVAGEALLRRIAHPRLDPAVVADPQHRAEVVDGADRVFLHAGVVAPDGVVVLLARAVVIEAQALAIVGGPGQGEAAGLVGVVDGLAAAAEAQRARVDLAGGI